MVDLKNNFQKLRAKKILYEGIKKFNLNLTDKVIFTEAASGNYSYTPISAAVAGAKKVYAIAKDSKYGKKEDIANDIYKLADKFNVKDKIEVVFDKTRDIVSQCDIITNTGFVRPIDKYMIDMMKPTAVIPLMWETWEVREGEIDLDYCKEKEIVILGTNENECGLNLNNGIGFLPLNMLFNAGLSVYNDKILVVGDCLTSYCIYNFFKKCDIDVYYFDFTNYNVLKFLQSYDAIIIAEHTKRKKVIDYDGYINPINISKNALICHISGDINLKSITENNLNILPKKIEKPSFMSISLDSIDSRAVIELTQAGLKVGEIMSNYRLLHNYKDTIKYSMEHPLVMGF